MAKGGNVRRKPRKVRPPRVLPAPSNTKPPGTKTGYAHERCYARVLADCHTKISREHYISETVLEGLGASFVVTDPRRGWESKSLPSNALAANILCKRHNEALSPLDTVAGGFVAALRAVEAAIQHGGCAMFSGIDVERWMLKVLAGMVAVQREDVPEPWVRVIFGETQILPPSGLHMNVRVGETVGATPDVLGFDLAYNKQDERVGIAMTLHGYRLLLGLDGNRVWDVSELGKESVLRPPHLHFRNSENGSGYRILLGWPPGEGGDGISLAWSAPD